MTEQWDLIIVGGGASGLAAAAVLAQEQAGRTVLVLEQADRPGRKLLATGNGRCNLYNTRLTPKRFISASPAALTDCLRTVQATDQLTFWHQLGLLTTEQEEGRVYPSCLQAAAVVDLLRSVALTGRTDLRCGQSVRTLCRERDGFLLTTAAGERHRARRVLLAAGGSAAPKLGATGDGYALAEQLGHRCTPLSAGLVPVRYVNPGKTLPGIRNAARVSLCHGERVLMTRRGEVQFTEYGLSGIVIMDLSSRMEEGIPYTIHLDLMPDYSAEQLLSFLREKAQLHAAQRAGFLLLGVVKRQLGEVLLRACRVDAKRRRLDSLTEAELTSIVQRMKNWVIRTDGKLSWEHAQVTCGGISLEEVNPDTFESLRTPGLYLTGELLDAAGDCGGFNLTWAFGTGIAAGRSAASA